MAVLLKASLDRGTLFVDHPSLSFQVPAIFGKPTTPTPPGLYVLERAHSSRLGMDILIFKRDGKAIFAIHPNLESRKSQLMSETIEDNFLSAGCIGVEQRVFDKLWHTRDKVLLEVR